MALSIFVDMDEIHALFLFLLDGKPMDSIRWRGRRTDEAIFHLAGYITRLGILPEDVHLCRRGWDHILRSGLRRFGIEVPVAEPIRLPDIAEVSMQIGTDYHLHHLRECAAALQKIEAARGGREAAPAEAGRPPAAKDGESVQELQGESGRDPGGST